MEDKKSNAIVTNLMEIDMKRKKKVQPKAKVNHEESPIRKWLEKHDKTQAWFGLQVGVQTATVNGWCNNKNTDMKTSNLVKVCEITGLSIALVAEWAAHHALEESGWDERVPA